MRKNKISAVMRNNLYKKNITPQTRKQYQRIADKFAAYVKETTGTERIQEKDYAEAAQGYFNFLQEKGLSPDTVHTHASGIIQALNFTLGDFTIKRRTRPEKGRNKPVRPLVGKRLEIGRKIGIRKAEIARLKGGDLKEHDGELFVIVRKGKGGKRQEQLILPQHREAIKGLFRDVSPEAYVFTREELKPLNKANTHASRREIAKEAYSFYRALTPEERAPYIEVAHQRFLENKMKGEKVWKQEQWLIKEKPLRWCRGKNKALLLSQGRKPYFDRECALLVSVLHLAHYRTDVTVDNYLC